ncbi:MAG: TM0996/MTH895 family glutaredoxin-like protein [Candidatus Fermentibacteraceae bacterium]|nr:TM0996/MTH895 family glutaredoxin-like protein [Candidatus Fermentibacteraceae bacterium]MBN2609897.1 TM0996/MTH895 family glutaredoxin-like protein [Candidatus Fermentibacteraceae bacterium]
MKIQILGMGCPKCRKLYESVEKAVGELELADVQLEKVETLSAISDMGVMMTPALAIDGNVCVAGRVPSVDEIKKFIQEG